MIPPEPLTSNSRLNWSPGIGSDVWKMFCACIEGDVDAVRSLVDKDAALVRCSYGYRTPLYFAVRENRVAVATYLLERGADPVGQSLVEAARDRCYAEMQQLLEKQLASVHGVSLQGEAVAGAIRAGDVAAVRALLDANPELLRAGDARGNLPVHWAVMTRQPAMIDEVLSRGADINAKRHDGARPVQLINGDYTFRGGRDVPKDWPVTPAQVLEHIRARGASVDICTACHLGDTERVKELLKEDPGLANRVSDYVTYYAGSGAPIRNAAAAGHLELVRLLLELGADPNLPEEGIAPRGHALYSAAANGHYEIAKLLLEHGAYCNPQVESSGDALGRAISNEDWPIVELLCSYGAAREVHLLGYYGDVRTAAAMFAVNPALANDADALTNAAGEGHEAFVQLLLRYEPGLPTRISFPPWSPGARTRELNELLFAHGMNPNQPDWLGVMPLHYMARRGDLEKAEVFIDHGADVNVRDEDMRSTPLAWAARFGKTAMAELLLTRGAKLCLPDDSPDLMWTTPIAWARRYGHSGIAELLLKYGPG